MATIDVIVAVAFLVVVAISVGFLASTMGFGLTGMFNRIQGLKRSSDLARKTEVVMGREYPGLSRDQLTQEQLWDVHHRAAWEMQEETRGGH